MGCDIHTIAQRRNAEEEWETLDFEPFDWRSYDIFGFLAGVRNYSAVTPISEPRGLPDDFVPDERDTLLNTHNNSWLSIQELLEFDYDKLMEDRRCDGGCTCDPGEGQCMTYREFLREDFFADLEKLKELGATRVVFGFDN